MAINRQPVLKRCKTLGINPATMGIDKSSNRNPKQGRKKQSEYGLGLANTRREARQIVNHGHITVNGQKVDIPSYLVKPGDVIAVREKSKNSVRIKEIVETNANRVVPKWLSMDKNTLTGKVITLAARDDIDYEVEEHLIVELYSK